MTDTESRLLRVVCGALCTVIRRELAADENQRIAYGATEAIGTPPRDLVEALRDVEQAMEAVTGARLEQFRQQERSTGFGGVQP